MVTDYLSTGEHRTVPAPAIPQQRPNPDQARILSIISRAQGGDREAFGELYDLYSQMVFRFIYFRVASRQLAEDMTSETFLRALKRIGSFTWQGTDIGAWFVTIARNLVADYYKSSLYRLEILTDDTSATDRVDPDRRVEPETAAVDHLASVELLSFLRMLVPDQQECLILRFLLGCSVSETAQAMGRNEGAVKALQYRAVRSMARLLPAGFGSAPEAMPW